MMFGVSRKMPVHICLKEMIPNLLTVTRLVAGLWFLFAGTIPASRTQLILLLLAVLTDVVDGRIARTLGTTSSFGAILDTLSDKIFVLCLLAKLVFNGILPYPLLIIILVQYALIPIGGFLFFRRFDAIPEPGRAARIGAILSIATILVGITVAAPHLTVAVCALAIVANTAHVGVRFCAVLN